MLTLELFEELEGPPEPTLIDALRDFLPLAVKHLKIKKLPKIKLLRDVETDHMPSFGKFSNDDRTVHLGIKNRHPNDILRTLAHEMVHYVQGEQDRLGADSGATGSTEEDEANAEAGVIMREFNQQFPQYMALKPIVFEEWTKKYKKSINCSNPKGFSQKAHCAGRKKNTNVAEGVPQPGPSSGAPKQFGSDAKIQTRQMTVKDIISSVPGVPYYNNVVDDWDAKDYSWGVTKKVIEYATYLKDHPESLAKLPPAIVLNGKFEDGAHRVSAIWLLQQRMDPKNPLWKNAKLNIQFVKQGVAEGGAETSWSDGTEKITLQDILELTKHIKQINLPINDNLKSKLIHWDGNPEEIERINQVTVSNQFPILIIVDEQGQIEFILDGNHRLHKAIQSQAKTIPAKLIKPSDLSDQAKRIFHLKEQGVTENFADGKNPQDKGDSQRHGIPKGATIAQLEKAAKAPGRKGQLARWQINMRRGKKK